MITIIANFDIKPDKVQEFIKHATNVAKESKKERGCLSYKIFTNRKDGSKFTFIEEWLNDFVIEEHNNTVHFKAFVDSISGLLNSEIKIEQIEKLPSAVF